jgi:hypothetical protein
VRFHMQTRHVVLMIEDLQEVLLYSLGLIWSHGVHVNKLLYKGQVLKLNTKLLLMLLQN